MAFIERIKNKNLYNFIKLYYSIEDTVFPSKSYLTKNLNIKEAKLRSFINIFLDCNFLYRKNGRYEIYSTKRYFSEEFNIKTNRKNAEFFNEDFKIMFNRKYISLTEPNISINSITSLTRLMYLLFSLSYHNRVCVSTFAEFKNNEMWIRKRCTVGPGDELVYECSFTQHRCYVCLTNDKN